MTGWLARRNYKPENDKGRKFEGRGDTKLEGEPSSPRGLTQLERRELFSPTSPVGTDEDKTSDGKTGGRSRNFFKRFRRK